MHERVISNTSPLLYLFRIGKIHLLEKIYGEVVVPYQVNQELEEGAKQGNLVPRLMDYKWLRLESVRIPEFLLLVPDLGIGEAATIALGMENPSDVLLVIDDMLGRRIAGLHNLRVTGLAGILMKSKSLGLIPSLEDCLGELRRKGFYLKQQVIDDMLKISGEIT